MKKNSNRKEKSPAAVALGKLGGAARMATQTPEERREIARNAAQTRWKGHQYSQKPSAVAHRKQRAKLKQRDEQMTRRD